MTSPIDELTQVADDAGVLDRVPLAGETPTQTQSRAAQTSAVRTRLKAADLSSRGIASFTTPTGDVKEIYDPTTGDPLNGFSRRTGIGYNSQGQPRKISYQSPTAEPTVSDPYEDAPQRIDKAGNTYSAPKGLPWQQTGTDPATVEAIATKRRAALDAEANSALSPEYTAARANLLAVQKQAKLSAKTTAQQLQALGVPTANELGQPTVDLDNDPEAARNHIEQTFNKEYASPAANASPMFGGARYTADATVLRKDIDDRKAAALAALNSHVQTVAQVQQSRGVFDQLRQQRQSLQGNRLDVVNAKRQAEGLSPVGIPGLDTLSAPTEPAPTSSAPVTEPVAAEQPVDDWADEPAQGAVQAAPFTPEEQPFRIDEAGDVTFDPARLTAGITAAAQAGHIDADKAAKLLPLAQAAEKAYQEQAKLLANDSVASKLKALGVGATKGAAFLAGAPAGAGIGAEAGSFFGPWGTAIGGGAGALISGSAAAWGAGKLIKKLGELSSTIQTFQDASEAHPYYDAAGNLIAFGAGVPKAASAAIGRGISALAPAGEGALKTGIEAAAKGYESGGGGLKTTIENLAADAANRQGATTLQKTGAIAARVGGYSAGNVAIDTAIKESAKALGISDEGQTIPGAVQAALIGAIVSGHGIGFKDVPNEQVADVMARGKIREMAGLSRRDAMSVQEIAAKFPEADSMTTAALSRPLNESETEIYNAAQAQVKAALARGENLGDGTTITARQAQLAGKPYGNTSAEVTPGGDLKSAGTAEPIAGSPPLLQTPPSTAEPELAPYPDPLPAEAAPGQQPLGIVPRVSGVVPNTESGTTFPANTPSDKDRQQPSGEPAANSASNLLTPETGSGPVERMPHAQAVQFYGSEKRANQLMPESGFVRQGDEWVKTVRPVETQPAPELTPEQIKNTDEGAAAPAAVAPEIELAARQKELAAMDERDPFRPLVANRIEQLKAVMAQEQEISAAQQERATSQPTATIFKTSKGSEYSIDENGNTTRLKKSEGRGQGEVHGAKPAVFLSPEAHQAVMDAGQANHRIVLASQNTDGSFSQLRPESGQDIRQKGLHVLALNRVTGAIEAAVKAGTDPKVGHHPFELAYDGEKKTFHMGNEITEITSQPTAPAASGSTGQPAQQPTSTTGGSSVPGIESVQPSSASSFDASPSGVPGANEFAEPPRGEAASASTIPGAERLDTPLQGKQKSPAPPRQAAAASQESGAAPASTEGSKGSSPQTRSQVPGAETIQTASKETVGGSVESSTESAPVAAKGQGGIPTRTVSANELPDAKQAAQMKWYHGTGANLATDTVSSTFANIESLFGSGVYLTDSPAVSRSYGNKRGKGSPKVFEFAVDPRNVLNFDKPLPADAVKAIESATYADIKPVISDVLEKNPNATGSDIWSALTEEVRNHSEDNNWSKSEYAEMYQGIEGNLRDAGYDAITHVGGLRVGDGTKQHKVLILLDPRNEYAPADSTNPQTVKSVTDVTTSEPNEPTKLPEEKPAPAKVEAEPNEPGGAKDAGGPPAVGSEGESGQRNGEVDAARPGETEAVARKNTETGKKYSAGALRFHNAELTRLEPAGVTVEFAKDDGDTAGLKLNISTLQISLDAKKIGHFADVVQKKGMNGQTWVRASIGEEIIHSSDAIASSLFAKPGEAPRLAFSRIHNEIANDVGADTLSEVSKIHGGADTPVVQAAEYMRMLVQNRRGELITEATSGENTVAMLKYLEADQPESVERLYEAMESVVAAPSDRLMNEGEELSPQQFRAKVSEAIERVRRDKNASRDIADSSAALKAMEERWAMFKDANPKAFAAWKRDFDAVAGLKPSDRVLLPDGSQATVEKVNRTSIKVAGQEKPMPMTALRPVASGSAEPHITGPALRDSSGAIVARGKIGQTHSDLIMEAAERGEDVTDAEHVFLDTQGNVLNRTEAARVADAAGQRNGTGPLHSQQLTAGKPIGIPGIEKLDQNELGFYSQLAKVVAEKLPNRATPQQIMATLDPAKSGVRKDELDWMGLPEFLGGKDVVTKADLLDFIRSNAVEMKEVHKGAGKAEKEATWTAQQFDDARTRAERQGNWDESDRLTRIQEDLSLGNNANESGNETKFAQYVLPGGENYKEVLLTLPIKDRQPKISIREGRNGWWDVIDENGRPLASYPTEQMARSTSSNDAKLLAKNEDAFHSSHWDEPNVLAHIRQADHTDTEGNNVRLIEEIQSDWHQAGRKQGYREEKEAELNRLIEQRKSPDEATARAAQDRINELGAGDVGVPDAPFKKTWAELAFKRALRMAVEDGMDKIAWTPGEQQAARYDLSKQIDSLYYDPDTTRLIASKNNKKVFDKRVPEPELENTIGKETARKLMESPKNMRGNHQLEGQELKVGGEGMKGFYDKILPDFVRKYVKKWGGKVETTDLQKIEPGMYRSSTESATVHEESDSEGNGTGEFYVIMPDGSQSESMSQSEAISISGKFNKPSGVTTVHSVTITPEMREAVMGGQQLFASKPNPLVASIKAKLTNGTLSERIQALSEKSGWTSIVDDIQKVLAPDERLTPKERSEFIKTGDINAIGDARKTGNILRGITAAMDRRKKQFEAQLKELRTLVDKLPLEQKHELQRRIDEGTPLKSGPIGDAVKQLVKLDAAKAQELKDFLDAHGMEHWANFQNFEKYIVPHAFTDQAEAAKVIDAMLRDKKMTAGTGFLKHREGFTIREIQDFAKSQGIDLVPKHDNIVDAVMDRWTQQERYMGAHQMIDRMLQNGTGHWEGVDYQPKAGEKMVNNIIGNRTVEVKGDDGTMSRRKQYFYADEPSAQIVNNYLSRGLRSGHKWIENYFEAANILNSAQLGLSFFHGGFVTMEGMVSSFANGLRRVLAGDLSGLKDIAMSPVSTWHDWKLGGNIREEMLNPEKFGQQHAAVVNAMVDAGFRDGVDSFYNDNHISKLMSAFREKRYLPGLLRAPWALIELMAKPIMEHYVPRMKAAAIYKMAQTTIKQSPGISAAELHNRLSKDVESGNNRFGQMTYDNLHLHKIVKDILMGMTRSLGWNWGTFSELGGGIAQWLNYAKNAAKATGNRLAGAKGAAREFPQITNKMAYTLALPLLVGLMGAALSAMFGKTPKELKDYYFIQTGETDERGNPVRVVLPSYMKDVFHAAHDPVSTVTNKLHPLLSTIGAMLENKDFYGVEIRHAGDPVMKQILQELGYAAKQFIPFTGRNAAKYAASKAPPIIQVGGFLGLTQAPARLGKSDAQNLADEINSSSMPTKVRTSEEAEKTQVRSQIIGLMRQGKGSAELADAQRKGILTAHDLPYIQRMAKLTPLQASVSRLSLPDAERVLDKATLDEKREIQPMVLAKRGRAYRGIPGLAGIR